MSARLCMATFLLMLLGAREVEADGRLRDPDGFETKIARAINAFDLDEAEALVGRYDAALGQDATSLYYRSRIATLSGDLEEAAAAAERCLQNSDAVSRCHEARAEAALVQLVVEGNVLKQLGAARTARRHLNQAVTLDPDNLRARLLLVRYYSLAPWFAGGSKTKAREQVAACEDRDAFWGHEASALLALAEARHADAVSGFQKAQALRPDERDPAYYLAHAYVQAGETQAAIDVLETLVSRYPNFHDAWLELGKLSAARGVPSARGAAALEHYLASATGAPRSRRVEAALALSRLHEAAGRPESAAETLTSARQEYPEARDLRRALERLCGKHEALAHCASG